MNPAILVIGAGPAGAMTAAGLKQLGYSPVVIDAGRSHPVMEGVAARVVKALQYLQFHHTLTTLSKPIPRLTCWNGEQRAANVEAIVYRPEFNAGLVNDLTQRGIKVIQGLVRTITPNTRGWSCEANGLAGGRKDFDYVVDARGRSINPLRTSRHHTIPRNLSVYQHWHVAKRPATIQLHSVPEGWLWMTNDGRGHAFSQLVIASDRVKLLLAKGRLPFIREQIAHCSQHCGPLHASGPGGTRGSTPVAHPTAVGQRYLRVGDAALAPDPLSGSGLFLAASTALIAPSVVNTQLQRPHDAGLATDFYDERLHHLYSRFTLAGGAFYHLENRWPEHRFWQERRDYYPDPSLEEVAPEAFTFKERAVVNQGWIERRRIPANNAYPLGIWKVNSVDPVRSRSVDICE